MSFLGDVHALVKEFFPSEVQTESDLEPYLSNELIVFLRSVQAIDTCIDRVLFYGRNSYRFYDRKFQIILPLVVYNQI